MIITLTLTFRASAETPLCACPVSRRGKVLDVGLHCSDLGKRCNVVKTMSLLPVLLHGSVLSSHGPAALQPSLTSPWLDLIDECPFPLLSIPIADLTMANAESCNAPSPSSLLALSSSSARSHPSTFSCFPGPSGLPRSWISLWRTCLESCEEDTQSI